MDTQTFCPVHLLTTVFHAPQTSDAAGRKPKPSGTFSSSSHPLTPGLKWSSTWNRSSEEGSCSTHKARLHIKPLLTWEKCLRQHSSMWADLVVVFIQHNHDLCHIVQFSHSTQVVHGLFPLLVLLLLKHLINVLFKHSNNKTWSMLPGHKVKKNQFWVQ